MQAEALDHLLDDRQPLVVVDIEVPEETLLSRLRSRRICRECGTPAAATAVKCGSCGGALVFRGARLERLMDRTVDALLRRLDRESAGSMLRTMHFPTSWDPYFRDVMSVQDVYLYGAQHFDHHRRQLTIRSGS